MISAGRVHTTRNLKDHMKIHSGEKSHECDQCGKAFFWASNLNKHMKSQFEGETTFMFFVWKEFFTSAVIESLSHIRVTRITASESE